MKLLLVCLCAMFALAFGQELEFKRTDETESMNRFETTDLASDDEILDDMLEKRGWWGNNHAVACQSGNVKSKYCHGPANSCFGNGQVVSVSFEHPYKNKPEVTIGFTLIDTNKDHNVRVRASVEDVTKSGFNIKFSPWGGSITHQVGVNWMACP